jgi:hypothetical protein
MKRLLFAICVSALLVTMVSAKGAGNGGGHIGGTHVHTKAYAASHPGHLQANSAGITSSKPSKQPKANTGVHSTRPMKNQKSNVKPLTTIGK